MAMAFLLALHLVSVWDYGYLVFAQDSDWKTIKFDDDSVSWTPELKSGGNWNCWTIPYPCRDEWFELNSMGHTYLVTSAPSEAQVSVKFQGVAIEVYGGAVSNSGIGLASIDGRPSNITFPHANQSVKVAAFPNLTANSTHILTIAFTKSPKTFLGFEYFKIQEQPRPQPSASQPSLGPSTTPVAPPGTRSGGTHVSPPQTGPQGPVGGYPDEGAANSADTLAPNIPVTVTNSVLLTITPHPSPDGLSGAEPSSFASSHHGLKGWQIALLVLGLIPLPILCFFVLRRWRRARTRAHPLVLDNNPPVEVKSVSVSGTVAPDNREATPIASPDYAFTRPGSSVSTSRDQHWRNSRIGVSPYLYQHPVPYPESTTDQSSYIDPLPIPVRRSMLATPPLSGAAVVRKITFSTKGRVLKVQNPDFRSNASTTETETPH